MLNVKKRDGNVVPFDLSKIKNAIEKAFIAEKKKRRDIRRFGVPTGNRTPN